MRRSGKPRQPRTSFAGQIASLSEPGGYFDTDNLISNERSYLEVLPDLDRRDVRGGAYIGVGPDQNFSYIAHIRPSIAFILDIRRDNLLLHLLFKALFQQARTRIEYLALLFGRPVPADIDSWRESPVARLAEYINRTAARSEVDRRAACAAEGVVQGFGVPLSADDLADDRSLSSTVHRTSVLSCSFRAPAVRRRPTTRPTKICCSRLTATATSGTTWRQKTRFNSSSRCRSATASSLSSAI